MLFSSVSFAQTIGAQSGQNQSATGTSAASIQSGAVAISSYGADSVRTVGSAPAIGFAGSFSSDYCAGTVGASGGWMGGSFGGGVPVDKESCVDLRVYERLQQGAASETDLPTRRNLRDASYEVLAEISPKIRGILSRRGVIHGQAAVSYDPSGTEGMQPAAYRIEDAAK